MFGNNDMAYTMGHGRMWRMRWGWFKAGVVVVLLVQFSLVAALFSSGLLKPGETSTTSKAVGSTSQARPVATPNVTPVSDTRQAVATATRPFQPDWWVYTVFVPLASAPLVLVRLLKKKPAITTGNYDPPREQSVGGGLKFNSIGQDLPEPLEFPQYRVGRTRRVGPVYGADGQRVA